MIKRFFCIAFAALLVTVFSGVAQTYTPEASNRVKFNLGATPWKMFKTDVANAGTVAFDDAAGINTGIPHCMAEEGTFVNNTSGGGSLPGGPYWYRKHFTIDPKYAGKKAFLEFEGVHMGCQVYVNGTLMTTGSAVNPQATHVVGFIGFLLDITSAAKFDGTDNVVAVRVAMNASWFTEPQFSGVFRFGQGSGGIFRPVWLHITDKVHVPSNVYAGTQLWGTYVATTAASDASATVRILTNVQNEGATAASVTLTTKIVDAITKNVVSSLDATQSIAAGTNFVFDQTATINNPKLWYPNASIFGKPNMHRVYHIVKVGGVTVDLFESPLGIRTITWDKDFPYINGKKHCLYGAAARYDYPALGTALPPEVEWRDAKILADIGGNLWRPGHSSCSKTFVEACDALGIMLVQPSGEGEGAFSSTAINENPTKRVLKKELHRDMIIRDRNNPSILSWEASNADIDPLYCDTLRNIGKTWDSLAPKAMAVRGSPLTAGSGDLHGCTLTGCDAQQKPLGNNINFPWWGSEYWGRHTSRFAYDQQIAFSGEFLRDWAGGIKNKCFGMVQWYLMETPGEVGDFLEGGPVARSFGSSMMDFNRIPKFLYYQYGVCWTPYSVKPRVAIAHHWNRSGTVRVNVFSNCPKVRLLVNGVAISEKTPNGQLGAAAGITDVSNASGQLPFQCFWDGVAWAAGTVRAEGLDANGAAVCTDEKVTAGAPHHVVLKVDAPIVKPNGEQFNITANGTDAALILATVVDDKGVWCPTATGLITWSVSGPGTYRGGTDQFVTAGKPMTYHAPGDPELAIEGGMAKVAVRSQFTTGTVTVSATVAGLTQPTASTTFDVKPVTDQVIVSNGRTTGVFVNNALVTDVTMAGRTIKYFISMPAQVSVEILNANGRIVAHAPAAKRLAGWHPVSFGKKAAGDISNGSGVYFVRLIVNGNALNVRKMVSMR